MIKRIFAVGYKDWIELRVSNKPLKAEKSTLVVPQTVAVRVPSSDWADPEFRDVKKKFRLNVAYYRGGKVVGGMSNRRFQALTGIWVEHNTCVEVTDKEVRDKIIKVLKEIS